jgi:hypothetical protein
MLPSSPSATRKLAVTGVSARSRTGPRDAREEVKTAKHESATK